VARVARLVGRRTMSRAAGRAGRTVTLAIDGGRVEVDGRRHGRRRHERFGAELPRAAGTLAEDGDVTALRTALGGSRLLATGVAREVRVIWDTGEVGYRIGGSAATGPPLRRVRGSRPATRDVVTGTALGLLTASVPTCCPPGTARHSPCEAPQLEVVMETLTLERLVRTLDARRCVGGMSLELGPLVRARALLERDGAGSADDLLILDVARAATTALRCVDGALVAIRSARGDDVTVLRRLLEELLSEWTGPISATATVVHGPAATDAHGALTVELVDAGAARTEVSG